MKKIIKEVKERPVEVPATETKLETKTEKEILLDLYAVLKARGINSIGDLENQISRA